DTGQGLDSELSRVPEEQAVRAARVDQGRRKQPGREGPPDAARPVACEDVERVVERRPRPPAPDEVAQDAGDEADDDRRHRADIPGGGVIATRPQTAPTAIPTAEGFFCLTQSVSIQLTAAPAAAKFVTTSAFTA